VKVVSSLAKQNPIIKIEQNINIVFLLREKESVLVCTKGGLVTKVIHDAVMY
jgi:hypothetical protein